MIAAAMAAISIIGCGMNPSTADTVTADGETSAVVTAELPVSFTNLAAEAVLTQAADEETHIQTNTLDLGSEETVGYFRILWPDLQVQQYTIEGSIDGETYETLYTSDSAPYFTEDDIELREVTQVRYIRMSGIASSALPVPEVYAENPWTSVEDALETSLAADEDGDTMLAISGLVDGIEYAYGGCNYETVIAAIPADSVETLVEDGDGPQAVAVALVQDTIEDKTVHVGFTLTVETPTGTWTHDTKDYEVSVPAQDRQGTSADLNDEEAAALGFNPRPDVIPTIQEWQGGKGTALVGEADAAWIRTGILEDSDDGQILYELVDDAGLGEEGYRIDIGCASAPDENVILVYANTETGLYWGNVTLRQMLALAENEAANQTADAGLTEDRAGNTQGEADLQLPRGRIRDYPIGSVRGIMLDVGRNTMSLSQIEQIARNLSWFKMNELTLHLQDNALLTYSDKTDSVENARTAYSAYRMESAITGEDGDAITAEDLSYTAEEFADLVETCAGFGVSIIPEIDTPAHSLALTAAFPDLGLSGRPDAVDMLDCSNPDALALAEQVWDEQLAAAFQDVSTIQIGGDEYYGQANDFVNYEAGLIDHLSTSGKTIRMWGSLTALLGDTRISAIVPGIWNTADTALTDSVKYNIEGDNGDNTAYDDNTVNDDNTVYDEDTVDNTADGTAGAGNTTNAADIARQQAAEAGTIPADRIQMQLWSTYWADPLTMYRAGFDLINSSSNRLYINCGEATDYLDKESLYNTYRRTEYTMEDGTTEVLPSWSPRVIGSSAALWNDLIDNLEIGISEYDMTDRVLDALPVMADRFWTEDNVRDYETFEDAAAILATSPDSDPLHQRDDLLMGPDYEVSFEVYLPSGMGEDVEGSTIFAVEADGNRYECKARQYAGDGDGQVGFSREFYDYAFDYTMPMDTRVRLTIVGHKDVTALYVDGVLVDTLGSPEAYEQHATFLFPTQVNEGFVGEVRNIEFR